jgi:hypothetical protein
MGEGTRSGWRLPLWPPPETVHVGWQNRGVLESLRSWLPHIDKKAPGFQESSGAKVGRAPNLFQAAAKELRPVA